MLPIGTRSAVAQQSRREFASAVSANRAGWRKGEGLEREWLIPSETWRGEICAGLDPKLVARTLWQAGILRRASDGFQQVRTIDGASKRVFVIGAAIFDGGGHEG